MTLSRLFRRTCALAALLACFMLTTATAQETQNGAQNGADGVVNERTTLLFEIGMTALAAAELTGDEAERHELYDKAIDAFRAILVTPPGTRCAYASNSPGRSSSRARTVWRRRHFEAVLAGGVPPPVAANIQPVPRHAMQRPQAPGPATSACRDRPGLQPQRRLGKRDHLHRHRVRAAALPRARGTSAPSPASACRCGAAASTSGSNRGTSACGCGSVATLRCGSIPVATSTSISSPRTSDRAGSLDARTDVELACHRTAPVARRRPVLGRIRCTVRGRPAVDAWHLGTGQRGIPSAGSPLPRLSRRPGGGLQRQFRLDAGTGAADPHDRWATRTSTRPRNIGET